jgi:predicted dienelactone hydrolase
MLKTPALILALAAALYGSAALSADTVGVRKISVVSQDNPRPLAVTVWYPAKADGEVAPSGGNRVFESIPVSANASVRDGRFPLILISHGSGSRAEGMGWIATKLAEAGFIVAGPNHPGTTSGDSTPAATPKVWERTKDISTIITMLSADKHWAASIDPARVGALGFSLGGTTVMELAGARGDLGAYQRYCVENPEMMDCHWFRGGHGFADGEQVSVDPLDFGSIDKARFEQSNRDDRIKAVVAVDPGLVTAFQPESLKEIKIPLALINLGSPGHVPVAVLSDKLANQVTGSNYAQVSDADHFSFLPVCKPGAADFLKSVGEPDPICAETARPRKDIHAELERQIVGAFTSMLKPGN